MTTSMRVQHKVPTHDIETKELQSLGFSVIDLSAKGKKRYDTNLLHRHTFYELFYFRNAEGTHEIDFNAFTLESHCVHFVSPGQIHKLSLTNTRGYVLCFTEEFVPLKPGESLSQVFPFFESPNSPYFKLKKQLSSELEFLVLSIYKEYQQRDSHAELIRHYLSILLLKLKINFYKPATRQKQEEMRKNLTVSLFKSKVNACFLLHQPVSEYARQLNISPNHLNALCKKHEGRTATQLIQQRMVLEAKRLLYATGLSVKEISFRLRFEDTGYFNRFFKSHVNLTPVQYRHSFHQKSLKSTIS